MVVNHPRVVFLVQVIEVNQLDQIFDQLQQQYFEDVEHRIKILNNLYLALYKKIIPFQE